MPAAVTVERRRIRVTGTVQGVGFRPFVYREALVLDLAGWVANDCAGVLIEVEGPSAAIEALGRALVERPPARARVDRIHSQPVDATHEPGFRIIATTASPRNRAGVAAIGPDIATCDACLRDLTDPGDRRYGYPFTSCTSCGPRYTIVEHLPYARASTTMADFELCERCRREFEQPDDRRFHAEPNACAACGPSLALVAPGGRRGPSGPGALDAAVALLDRGGVLALKGIGGFHLACDGTDARAVQRLRRGKGRDEQPFAVMVATPEAARDLVVVDVEVEEALCSPQRPIVLAPRRLGASVAANVAPGLDELGVLLPYTPLHHLLTGALGRPLVMTSGNVTGEPIARDEIDAARLMPPADRLLVHDRRIYVRCDDSVVRVTHGRARLLRRSRGYVPEPLELPVPADRPVLAVGAGSKATVAIAHGGHVVASHHIGDIDDLACHRAFEAAIDHLCRITGVVPELVAHDLHPDLRSTAYALDLGLPAVAVQHHHAHVAACLVDNLECGPVIGVAFDGLGLGTDGMAWGGEFLLADLRSSTRVGHLRPVPLPGGSAATREPWRMALAWVHEALGPDAARSVGPRLDAGRWSSVLAVIERHRTLRTSAAGRLFDAVAALLGVRGTVSFEGQAAMELEALAGRIDGGTATPPIELADQSDHPLVVDPSPLVAAVVDGLANGADPAVLAASFHDGFAELTARVAATLAAWHGARAVALTGGVFQNRRFTDAVVAGLDARGARVLLHERVPPNDGGISIGQAAVAAARLREGSP